jgi:hypothetical protein
MPVQTGVVGERSTEPGQTGAGPIGQTTDAVTRTSGDATAQAISASSPCYFVTDANPVGTVVPVWESPLLVVSALQS